MKTVIVGTNDKIVREIAVLGTRALMHSRKDPSETWFADNPQYRTVVFLATRSVQTVRKERIRTLKDTGGNGWGS